MALPADFPKPPRPPKRPPANEPMQKIDGTPSLAWLNYHDRYDRWAEAMLEYEQAVRTYLDSL